MRVASTNDLFGSLNCWLWLNSMGGELVPSPFLRTEAQYLDLGSATFKGVRRESPGVQCGIAPRRGCLRRFSTVNQVYTIDRIMSSLILTSSVPKYFRTYFWCQLPFVFNITGPSAVVLSAEYKGLSAKLDFLGIHDRIDLTLSGKYCGNTQVVLSRNTLNPYISTR